MMSNRMSKLIFAATLMALACPAQPLFACAACYGKTDSQLAAGMNWGIMSLLVVVVFVLSSVASFFIFLAKKAAAARDGAAQTNLTETTQKT